MSIDSVISMIVRAPLEFERKSNESKVLARREQAAASGSGLQGSGTVVRSGEPRNSPIRVTASISRQTRSYNAEWKVELATRSRYAREHARVLVSFLQRQESGSWVQFQTVPALGRQERASAILARPRGLRRSWSPSSYASKSYVGRCMRMAQAGW